MSINTTPNENIAPPDRILREAELRTLIPYSGMHLGRLEKAGRFRLVFTWAQTEWVGHSTR